MVKFKKKLLRYCYENGNSVISFNIKIINKSYTNKYIKLVTSKPITSVWEKEIHNQAKATTSKNVLQAKVNKKARQADNEL